jgi:N-acetyl sugar amidotransferase
MDTTDPLIEFDAEGICNHCRRWEARVAAEIPADGASAERRIAALVDRIQREGRGKTYDCIIGVSGGVDSTTVAYHVKRLGLRPLAVHLDNGWNTELAVDNIRRTLEVLGIDLYTHVLDWDEFRDLQVAFLRASVPNCEIPTDHAISALMMRLAARHGIRFVISGGNLATEGILPLSWTYYNQDLRHLRAIHRRFGRGRLRTYPTMSLGRWGWYVLGRRIRVVRLLNLVGYSKTEATALIKRELGWRPYPAKHFESLYTRFYQGHYLPTKFGYDKRRAHFSTLVMAGDMTRDQALAEMERHPYADGDLPHDREYVLRKLRLTPDEFQQILEAPNRRHEDYPSNARIFHGMSSAREWFKRLATAE